jgi:hypothetical protein
MLSVSGAYRSVWNLIELSGFGILVAIYIEWAEAPTLSVN